MPTTLLARAEASTPRAPGQTQDWSMTPMCISKNTLMPVLL